MYHLSLVSMILGHFFFQQLNTKVSVGFLIQMLKKRKRETLITILHSLDLQDSLYE